MYYNYKGTNYLDIHDFAHNKKKRNLLYLLSPDAMNNEITIPSMI